MAPHQTHDNGPKNEGHSAPQNIKTKMKRSPTTIHAIITYSQFQDSTVKIAKRRMETITTP
jgi:hypothetical protein